MNNSWAFKEAQDLANLTRNKDSVITFECGYGPSGLPHLGTFAEVARTQMVRKAFEEITGKKTRLIVFSDDMDALRKVPTNIPQYDKNGNPMENYIGMTLSYVPNPFDTDHESFAEHNNAMLQRFLDSYGFEYEFMSSKDCYQSGVFNKELTLIADNIQKVKDIVTHDYGNQGGNRKETYCPFIPINPFTQVQFFELEDWKIEGDLITWFDGEKRVGTSIHNGFLKCQWKVDWVLRWLSFDVDYEMHGKDLIGSAQVGEKVCKALGRNHPKTYMYELFVDENNEKISKSKGNGLEFKEWLRYAPVDSLRWFLFQNPRKSRQLHIGMVANTVDSYIRELGSPLNESNGVYAIYGNSPPETSPVSYSMLLNLVNITNTSDKDIIWKYINNYEENVNPESNPLLDEMVSGAINYYKDFIEPNKDYRIPSNQDKNVLNALALRLEVVYDLADDDLSGKDLSEFLMSEAIYPVGKEIFGDDKDALRDDYFKMLYQVLMGQNSGPRFGQFAVIYGVNNTIDLLRSYV